MGHGPDIAEILTLIFPDGSSALAGVAHHPAELPATLRALGLLGKRPVLALVGGAGGVSPEQSGKLRHLFTETLAPLAEELRLCVVDGGTDAGVMRLMGEARAQLGATFPLVGVAASGTVELPSADEVPSANDGQWSMDNGQETVGNLQHEHAINPPTPSSIVHCPSSAEGTSSIVRTALEPNHTHYVLVPGTGWGDESPWLAAVAGEIAGDRPSLTLLVNGGEIAWDDARHSLEAGRPVLALAGTGRAADHLASAVQGDGPDERASRLVATGLVYSLDPSEDPHLLAETIRKHLLIRETIYGKE